MEIEKFRSGLLSIGSVCQSDIKDFEEKIGHNVVTDKVRLPMFTQHRSDKGYKEALDRLKEVIETPIKAGVELESGLLDVNSERNPYGAAVYVSPYDRFVQALDVLNYDMCRIFFSSGRKDSAKNLKFFTYLSSDMNIVTNTENGIESKLLGDMGCCDFFRLLTKKIPIDGNNIREEFSKVFKVRDEEVLDNALKFYKELYTHIEDKKKFNPDSPSSSEGLVELIPYGLAMSLKVKLYLIENYVIQDMKTEKDEERLIASLPKSYIKRHSLSKGNNNKVKILGAISDMNREIIIETQNTEIPMDITFGGLEVLFNETLIPNYLILEALNLISSSSKNETFKQNINSDWLASPVDFIAVDYSDPIRRAVECWCGIIGKMIRNTGIVRDRKNSCNLTSPLITFFSLLRTLSDQS